MPRSFDVELSDVQAVIGKGRHDVGWVPQEFADVDLGDKRRNRRLIKTAEHLAASIISPINEACGTWADAKAAYRLFDNKSIVPAEILRPHVAETAKRMVACGETVLAVQDTVFFSYQTHPNTTGLGPIGKSSGGCDRGLIMHNALAFSASGLVLGILSQQIWARKETSDETAPERVARLACTPIEEKESFKWLKGLRETMANTPPGVNVVTVCDRESDFYEFIAEATNLKASYLIRARVDRQLDGDDGFLNMTEAINSSPVLGTLTLEIPGNGKRKARTAVVVLRSVEVTIPPPRNKTGKAKAAAPIEPITVTIVAATETLPPEGAEAVSWVLLTNLPVRGFDDAAEKVEWYARRWSIEVWHKVLKSGCKVEDCLLETADRLKRFLTLFSIIGFRVMHITYFARVRPDAPGTDLFSGEEVEALHIRVKRTEPPREPPPVKEVVRMLGCLGGHLGRKLDGEPGTIVIWRGLMRLFECVEVLQAYKEIMSVRNTA
ncbi:MAG: IS4 family transposase [Acidiferrobacteraceae bacterium]